MSSFDYNSLHNLRGWDHSQPISISVILSLDVLIKMFLYKKECNWRRMYFEFNYGEGGEGRRKEEFYTGGSLSSAVSEGN